MKIIQISVVKDYNNDGNDMIYGLGDDNQIYYWDRADVDWVLDDTVFE